LIKKVPNLAVH